MKYHYFFNTIRKVIIHFLDMFNDINIARYDDNGEIFKYIKVPIKFIPKEKMFMWLKDRRHDKYFPIISAQVNGISLNIDRITNKNEKLTLNIDDVHKRIFNPTPYTINFQLNIISKFMVDQDQILEQILPFFTPHAFIMIDIPELGLELENKVIFNSCNMDKSFEISTDAYRTIVYTLDFDVQTYLFNPIVSTTKYYLTYNNEEYVLIDGVSRYITPDCKIEIKDFKVYINDVRQFDVYLYEINEFDDIEKDKGELNYIRNKMNEMNIVKFYDYDHKYFFEMCEGLAVFYGKPDELTNVIKKLITKYYTDKTQMLDHKGSEIGLPSSRGVAHSANILHGDDEKDPLFNIYKYEKFADGGEYDDEGEEKDPRYREWKKEKEND